MIIVAESSVSELVHLVGWLFWVQRPFETVFQSISDRLPKRGRRSRERIDESKMSKQPPPAPTSSAVGPCPTFFPNCRTPRHWKLTQGHRTYRPPTRVSSKDWLIGWFGFNGPLRQYFSLYRAVSQREGERGEKG